MPAGRVLLAAAFSCALGARYAHAYSAIETPLPTANFAISQPQAETASSSPTASVPASAPIPAADASKDKAAEPAASKPPEKPSPGAANDAADSGRKMFDGAKAGSGGGAETSLSGMGSAAAAATKDAGKPPGAQSAEQPPPPAVPVPEKGLVIPEIPQPVQVAAPVTQATGGASWWNDWTGSVKGWAGEAWNGIRQTVTDLAKEMMSLFARLGERFKNAFMSVWGAPDTVTMGSVNSGRLGNGIQMPNIDTYAVRNPSQTFGSKHMVLGLMYVGGQIKAAGGPPMKVGDISNRKGGQIDRHKSHQNGLDVDIYFYYANGRHDTAWNFRVLQGLCRNPYFEPTMLFVSPRVKSMLLAEARRQGDGETASWASRILNVNEPGHDNHYHLRISPQPKQPAGRQAPGK
ncbi:MAG: penicillin-insensitive murein endopeptidase [Elusimicrobiota bacterium]|jgi:hypothetical protein